MKYLKVFKNRDFLAIFLLLVLLSIVYHEWIFNLSILTKGDWGFLFKETLETIRADYFSLWLSDFNFGRVLIDVGQAVTYAGAGALGKFFGINWAIIERVVYFFPVIFVTTFSSYIFIRYLFKNKTAALVGSFVYTFNTYFLTLETGHLTLAAAFAFGPLVFYFFYRTLTEKKLRYGIITALVFFISSSYEPRAAYILGILLIFYGIWHVCLHRDLTIRGTIPAIVGLTTFALLNFYWLFGLIHIKDVGSQDILIRNLWGGQYYEIASSISLFHPWWTGFEIISFEKQSIPFHFFFVPLTAFLGMLVKRKNSLVVFFGFISLLGILLTKQQGLPFPHLYSWLFEHFPGFNAFREASKFYFLTVIGYSVLISAFVAWMWDQWNNKKIGAVGKHAITFFIAFLFLWNTKPFITGEIKSLFVPRQIPKDYLILKQHILSESKYFRTLWIPRDSRWGIYTSSNSKLVAVSLSDGAWKTFAKEESLNPLPQNRIMDPLMKTYSPELFSSSIIRYVIVPLQDIANDDDFFIHYGGRENPNIRQWYIDELDQLPYLKRIDIGTQDLVVYENENYKPYVFPFTSLSKFSSTDKLEEKYSFIADTLQSDFSFTVEDPAKQVPSQAVSRIFENIAVQDLGSNHITISLAGDKRNTLFTDNKKVSTHFDPDKNTVYMGPRQIVAGAQNPLLQNLPLATHEQYTFEYNTPEHTYGNVIPNPSFEKGLWSKEVGDCNNYDDDPVIDMQLSKTDKSEGNQSLQLEATRHIACTNLTIPVESGKTYLFSFDYQSANANSASYYFVFNDEEETSIDEEIPIIDNVWHTFTREITVPATATSSRLYLYSGAVDEQTNVITRYDNFHLVELPDNLDDIWFVSDPGVEYIQPREVTFDIINPTKKLVHVKGAATPFYLAMSESYHPEWQLQMNNTKVHGVLQGWWPFVTPDRIADEQHFELNGFLNGWYVDVEKYCRTDNMCTKNEDGTYDMELVVEFFPQRWFYLGLLISGTTLIACLGYLGYDFLKRKRRIS